MKLKSLSIAVALVSGTAQADLTTGEDILYAVKATTGSTQDFGTIDPADGSFTRITQISPTGLGWPLGDAASDSDPVNGYVFSNQNSKVLAIKKTDGSTRWLETDGGSVVGYDTKVNQLILYKWTGSANRIIGYNTSNGEMNVISSSFASENTSWQAGGRGAVDSFGRTAFQLNGKKLYKVNLDDGSESSVTMDAYVTTIAWDSKKQKLYGIYDSNSNGPYRIAEIDVVTGELTNVSAADTINGMGNYVQLIAPNDQRYYVLQQTGQVIAISLIDGAVLGTFAAPLRLLPPSAVVVGSDSEDETVSYDITDPSSLLLKFGENTVDFQGDSDSSGDILVEDGILLMNGDASDAEAVVSVHAVLGGSGTVGGITSSGTVAPGNSIGTLNVSGDVTFASGSTFIVEIDASGNTDKLVATGDVTVDGELQISTASGTYDNQTYVFLTGSSLTGEFSEVSITGCSATPAVTIGDTQASFTIVSCSSNNSSNEDAVISYLNDLQSGASGDLLTVINAINALSGSDYSAAVAQLDHDGASASVASISQVVSAAGASISSRISTVASSPDVSTFALMMADDGQQLIDLDSKKTLLSQRGWWINLFGGSLDADEQESLGVNGYKNDYAGTTIGYDVPNSEGGLTGFAVTYSSGQVDADGSVGSTDYSSVVLSPYYAVNASNGGVTTFYGHLGSSSNDGQRYISFGAIDRTASSSYDSLTYGLGAEHQQPTIEVDGRYHSTRFGLGVSVVSVDGFTETGADALNLAVDAMDQTIVTAMAGHRIHWEYQIGAFTQMPFVDFGVNHSSFLEDQQASQALLGQSKFTTTVGEDSELSGSVGTGLVMKSKNNQFSFGVKYKQADYYSDVSGSLEYKRFF